VKFLFNAGCRNAAAFTLVYWLLSPSLLAAPTGSADYSVHEGYRDVPMPEGFSVVINELDGPVFVNSEGKTLYQWPQKEHRNGYSGEPQGSPQCGDEVVRVTAGLMSPYPPGILLPELDTRPSCTDLWPPEFADEQAEEVGEWTLIERADGRHQWSYDEQALYTSIRDVEPGDSIGGRKRRFGSGFGRDDPAYRIPLAPPQNIPPGFAIQATTIGRMLTTDKNEALYSFDQDTASSTACEQHCLHKWQPIFAPALARSQGDWSILERSPGVRQWVFRGKPLYRYLPESRSWSQLGSDEQGWHNVFTQPAPAYPPSFTRQATIVGEVLANAQGHTIYLYFCADDSEDQLACDHPLDTQVYRFAMCGGGDPDRCLQHWPYVLASPDEHSINRTWTVLNIDPTTGRPVREQDLVSTEYLRVWAYRDRPVYTYGIDKVPGDVHGGGIGEWRGQRNGLRAFWLRNDFMSGILR